MTILTGYATAVLLYVLYLAYCTLRQMSRSGRLAQLPLVVRAHCTAILAVAVGVDIAFNVVFGSILFLELPEFRRLTFTARCQKWLPYFPEWNSGLTRWRGAVAHWVCESWLNPAEPGHC